MGIWITRDGESLPIAKMESSHLLNTIHMIERGRMQRLLHVATFSGDEPDDVVVLNYYAKWPDAYLDLLAEAERRGLIQRAPFTSPLAPEPGRRSIKRRRG